MEINAVGIVRKVMSEYEKKMREDLPKDVCKDIDEMGECATEIFHCLQEAKQVPDALVARYNDLSMRQFPGRNRKLKAMISQPMNGLSEAEIAATRARAKANLEGAGYEFMNTLFTDEWYSEEQMEKRGVVNKPLCFLAKSIENMCECDAAYFCKGWDEARGCRIEHEIAKRYGVRILYEEDFS